MTYNSFKLKSLILCTLSTILAVSSFAGVKEKDTVYSENFPEGATVVTIYPSGESVAVETLQGNYRLFEQVSKLLRTDIQTKQFSVGDTIYVDTFPPLAARVVGIHPSGEMVAVQLLEGKKVTKLDLSTTNALVRDISRVYLTNIRTRYFSIDEVVFAGDIDIRGAKVLGISRSGKSILARQILNNKVVKILTSEVRTEGPLGQSLEFKRDLGDIFETFKINDNFTCRDAFL